jgi:hypothetical protein
MAENPRESLRENDWKVLLQRLKTGTCTPFIGAGADFGVLPLGADIAREWAKEYAYPFEDSTDLVRVAQYLTIEFNDGTYPKDLIRMRFASAAPPNFHEPDEPHGLLADLHLPIYLTTNYDDFMARALADRHRDPRRDLCRWSDRLKAIPSVFNDEPGYKPNVANPLVFHLHGMLRLKERDIPHSLVLTEDDYLEFLVNLVHDTDLLPLPIREALTNTSLLFIGYRLADWNFRVMYQSLRAISRFSGLIVMLPPQGGNEEKALEFYREQYRSMDLKVYWGTARQFCAELRQRLS